MQVKLLTWNVAGRVARLPEQTAAVGRRDADLVALQEVRASTAVPWIEALAAAGLPHIVDSSASLGPRRIFNLTASRWPLAELHPLAVPQPERVLSALTESPTGQIEIHNAHIPPAPSNGLIKVETCEALFEQLARPADRHRLLCGDFNTPRRETIAGEVETFASNHPQWFERWDAAERSILTGLAEWDLHDVFRGLHGYERRDISWAVQGRPVRRGGAHRLDHILASSGLGAIDCDYLHEWRELGLSDHAAMEAVFEPRSPG